jgi:hypothetical protein
MDPRVKPAGDERKKPWLFEIVSAQNTPPHPEEPERSEGVSKSLPPDLIRGIGNGYGPTDPGFTRRSALMSPHIG